MKQEMPLLILKDLFSCFLRAKCARCRSYGAWENNSTSIYKHPAPPGLKTRSEQRNCGRSGKRENLGNDKALKRRANVSRR
jgi:hypothetical protein